MIDTQLAPIEAAYAAAQARASAAWAASSDAGPAAPLPYDEATLAYTFGGLFAPPATLVPLVDEIGRLARHDATIVPVPREALHFTFLAATPHRWNEVAAMPDPATLLAAARTHLAGVEFRIERPRLLPGANAILLAGLPSLDMLRVRDRLIADLLPTPAGEWLKERYGPVFPPIFWHTTLARSRTALCPSSLREFYDRHRDERFEPLAPAAPALHAASYDWARRVRIE